MATCILTNQSHYPLDLKALTRFSQKSLKALKMTGWSIDITFVTKPVSKRINSQYLNHHYATDILTFDVSDPNENGADIYICPAIAKRQAHTFSVFFDNEIKRLIIHGLLHLIGYDDTNPKAKKVMFAKQEALLEALEA